MSIKIPALISAFILIIIAVTLYARKAIESYFHRVDERVSSVTYLDGAHYRQSAAGLNSALSAASPNGIVEVPSSATDLSALAITVPKGVTLRFRGRGTFRAVIRLTDSTTDNTGIDNIDCPEGATIKLPNNANTDLISDVHFPSLTGTSNFFGWVNSFINGCILDGNKANNTSGFALRIYGRGERLSHVRIQNAAQPTSSGAGFWTEWGGTESDTIPLNEVECRIEDLVTNYNAGSGWIHKGPNDCQVSQFVSDVNGYWGWDVRSPVHATQVNTFENDNASPGSTGGIICHFGGAVLGADIVASTATGWGMLAERTCGGNIMTASSWGAVTGVPLEVRSSSASLYEGQVGNETSGLAALKLNGAGNGMYFLNFFGGTRTFNVLVSSEVAPNTILAASDGIPTSWFSGTPAANDSLLLGAIPGRRGTAISQYPLRSLRHSAPLP